MARNLTSDQRALLMSPSLRINVLAVFYLDEGTFRFCDDVIDVEYGGHTYLGASALASAADIKSGDQFAAESVTLVLDGNRMAQYGIEDPARVLRDIMGYLTAQRRVDLFLSFRAHDSRTPGLVIQAYAGKINAPQYIDPAMDIQGEGLAEPVEAHLEIVIDSLAMRYSRATHRTRSHPDQLKIDPTDRFFSFVSDAVGSERTFTWGAKSKV